jgi:hypothetical protein
MCVYVRACVFCVCVCAHAFVFVDVTPTKLVCSSAGLELYNICTHFMYLISHLHFYARFNYVLIRPEDDQGERVVVMINCG